MEPNENIDPDDILKRVLDSIEKRREELETGSGMDETKENSILMTSTHNVEIQMNAVLTTSGSNIQLKQPNEEDEKVRRRSRFSEIAANQVEFEKSVGDLQKKKEVEARMPKAATVSARRRSAVLEKIEEAQKRASGSDSSSDSRKSVSNSNSDAKAVTFAAGHQRSPSHGDNAPKSTPILQNSVICLDDSAANESKDKLTPLKSASSLPSAADIWSPKPYNSATKSSGYSPILSGLTSSSRSSPKITTVWTEDAGRKSSDDLNKSIVTTETIKLSTSSPVRSTAIQPGSARKVAQLLEQKFKPAGTSSKPGTPTLPAGVQTQFRGAHCVPVVAGAKAADPTPKPKMTPGNVNQLKSRWEFVSATGTPIHPDESEDALLAAARRMQEKVPFKPRTFGRIANPGKNAGFKESSASSHSREASSGDEREQERREQHTEIEKNEPGKPASSLALFNGSVSPISKAEEAKEAELEDEVFELEHPVGSGQHKLDDHNTSRMIDEAFGFMGTYDSPTSHLSRSPIKQTIFENEFGNMQGSPMQGSSLPYTISFYRKMAKEMHEDQNAEKIDLNAQMSTSSLNTNQAMAYSSPMKDGAKKVDVAKLRMFLEKELMAQEERISQATRALAYCQERPEFAGSREEVDAQRACLIATETFNVLRNSLLQLETGKRKKIMGPLGELTFRSIVIRLDQNYNFHPNPMEIYYFLVLIRCGDLVEASKIVSSDEALRNELRMDFALGHRVTLNNLQPDFEAFLDIYCLRAKREILSHEEKYKLPGATLKKKGVLGGVFESNKSKTLPRGSGPSYVDRVTDRKFNWAGRMVVNLKTPARSKHTIKDVKYPLDSEALIKFTKAPITRSDISHKAFLSLFQRTVEGLASWVRMWCHLTSSEICFWKAPEDEGNGKPAAIVIDLLTLAPDGVDEDRSACPYPNSFHLDMWTQKHNNPNEVERMRVSLAADTKAEMVVWLDLIRKAANENSIWNSQVITTV